MNYYLKNFSGKMTERVRCSFRNCNGQLPVNQAPMANGIELMPGAQAIGICANLSLGS